MKHIIPLFTFTFCLHLAAPAAVPCPWTVEMTRAQPATFEYYQGETIAFEATLTARGKPFEAPSNYSFFWQTNGMGNLYWEAPQQGGAGVPPAQSNVLFATWLPSYDCGALVYKCFIGSPSNNYHTAFQLRLLPSPGATPNALPLPQKVIDFAKVTVLNPPWSGGGGGSVDTNAVRDIVREQLATNGIRAVDGAARPLPKYLHLLDFDDTYPADAAWYYSQPQDYGLCSSVRDGGFLYRNYDWTFDDMAEFVVRITSGPGRFASVGVANCGTNLTEEIVTSGQPSRYYKCLPGRVVDGINENGVACNINVVDGPPQWGGGVSPALHPLAAIRWILDHATNAQHAAEYIALHIRFPQGWTQNFHYMVADETSTYIVENGTNYLVGAGASRPRAVMTNFRLYPTRDTVGEGQERYALLASGANITNVWYTNAYRRETNPPWVSDLADVIAYTNEIFDAWASHPKEYFRNSSLIPHPSSLTWWQTVHTSVYDLTNRTLRVSVQETGDWYVFAVPGGGGVSPAQVREIVKPMVKSATNDLSRTLTDSFDTKLAGKVSVDENGFIDDRVRYLGRGGYGGAPTINVEDHVLDGGDWSVGGDVYATDEQHNTHRLSTKADRPSSYAAGNLAALDENGDLTDGGKKKDLVVTMLDPESPAPLDGDISINGAVDSDTMSVNTITVYESIKGADGNDLIHHTNETFSNEVAEVAKTVTPAPSTSLRLFDPVLNRWVILKSVNMNITLEVE